jgi:hypothetical protein
MRCGLVGVVSAFANVTFIFFVSRLHTTGVRFSLKPRRGFEGTGVRFSLNPRRGFEGTGVLSHSGGGPKAGKSPRTAGLGLSLNHRRGFEATGVLSHSGIREHRRLNRIAYFYFTINGFLPDFRVFI